MKEIRRKIFSIIISSAILLSQTTPMFAAENQEASSTSEENAFAQETEILSSDTTDDVSDTSVLSETAYTNLFFEHEKNIPVSSESALEFNSNDIGDIAQTKWYSSDDSTAVVDDTGVVKGITEGEAKIYLEITSDSGIYRDACLITVTPEISLMSASVSGNQMYNTYISVIASSSEYSMGTKVGNPDSSTDDDKKMLYGWSSGAGTSFTTIVVDGNAAKYNSSTNYDAENQQITGTLNQSNVTFYRNIRIVKSTVTGREDTVEFTYTAVNNDTLSHTVGGRIFFDTMLGSNDSAPFYIPGVGKTSVQTELTGDDIPQYWQSMDSLTSPTIVSQGTLYRSESQKPDLVQFGSYSTLHNTIWNAHISPGNQTGDSGVAVTWNEAELAPGESRSFTTYYGISELTTIESVDSNISVSVTGDTEAVVNDSASGYNPITVTAYLQNTGTEAETNVTASIDLPSAITLASGYSQRQSVGTLSGGSSKQVSWTLNPSASDSGAGYSYNITISSADKKDIVISRNLSTPLLDLIPPSIPTLSAQKVSSNSAVLSWSAASDTNGIKQYVLSDASGNIIYSGSDTSYPLSELTTGKSYTYNVYAVDSYDNKSSSSHVTFTTAKPELVSFTSNASSDVLGASDSPTLTAKVKTATGALKASFYYSTDGSDWKLISSSTANTVTYTSKWYLNNIPSGTYTVKVVITDVDGASVEKTLTLTLDTQEPGTVKNFTASPSGNKIILGWQIPSDNDIKQYEIYHSTNGSTYSLYATVDKNVTYYSDNNADYTVTNYYKVYAVDNAGNKSEAAQSSVGGIDIQAPIIKSWSYASNSVLSASKNISILVVDNVELGTLKLEYKAIGSDQWQTLSTNSAPSGYSSYWYSFSVSSLSDGTYTVRVQATDASNNQSAYSSEYTYIIDKTAPVLSNIEATPGIGRITLSWSSSDSDVSYSIYRKSSSSSTKIASITDGSTSYADLTATDGPSYIYTVTAYDAAGNSSSVSSSYVQTVHDRDDEYPVLSYTIPSIVRAGVSAPFDASGSTDNIAIKSYSWDFGDGSVSSLPTASHTYASAGTYTVTLKVTDTSDNTKGVQKTITVRPSEGTGVVNITVTDENGTKLSGAGVYYKVGAADKTNYETNVYGSVSITDAPGTYDIGIYKDGYLPSKETVTIEEGKTISLTLPIKKQDIVVGDITTTKLTATEIANQGLDPYAAENQSVYKYDVVIASNNKSQLGTAIIADKAGSSAILTSKITSWDIDSDGDDSLDLSNAYIIIVKKDINDIDLSDADTLIAVLDSPAKASWLNDLFNVQLHIINQADEDFALDDCKVKLNCPDGLTIINSGEGYANSAQYDMGTITGGNEAFVNWMLRGDKEGSYNISADFTANLRDFDESVNASFTCCEPVKVQIQEGLTLLCDTADKVKDNTVYFKIGLKNERDTEVTLTNFGIDGIVPSEVYTEKANGKIVASADSVDAVTIQAGDTYWKYYAVDVEQYSAFLNYGLDTSSGNIFDIQSTLANALTSHSKNNGIKIDDIATEQYTENTVTIDNKTITTNPVEVITLPAPSGTDAADKLENGYQFVGWVSDNSDAITLSSYTVTDQLPDVFLTSGSKCVVTSDLNLHPVWVGISEGDGASVRTATPTGLRFNVNIDTDSYNDIMAIDPNAQCGVLITPWNYLDYNGDNFTTDWLTSNNKVYLDIETKAFAAENSMYKQFRGVIANIKANHYNYDFAARGYIRFTYSNGETGILYTNFSSDKNVRNVADVAQAALNDSSISYTSEQKNVLQQFIQ